MEVGDMDIAELRRSLPTTLIGKHLQYYQSTGSTMDLAREAARKGSPEGTVILAEEQTQGRGRFDRQWIAPPKDNLYFSVILYPTSYAFKRLTMASSLGVARGITNASGLPVSIKWPNDIRSNGKKLGGILLESAVDNNRIGHAVIGIGINVNLDPSLYPDIAETSTSLKIETGRPVSREAVLKSVLQELDNVYLALTFEEDLRKPWIDLLETLGKWVQVTWGDEQEEGFAEDVNEYGELILRRSDNSFVNLPFGEVTLQV
jgi:BirA family biotin operon repressor/biotin-[acetyl-CoA-carboxylase] ligase